MLQDQTQMMLHEYCASPSSPPHQYLHEVMPNMTRGHNSTTATGRFGKLLLVLPALKTVQSSCIIDLFFRKLIGEIPISRLLADLMTGTV